MQEREKKRNMAALTPQFKIKYGLQREEFVRVVYVSFFLKRVYRSSIKTSHVGERLIMQKMQLSEDVIFVGGDAIG